MGRRTKPVALQVVAPFLASNARFRKRLIDFDTDSDRLEDAHKTWLRESITIAKTNSAYHLRIFGYASKIGDPGYNRALSLRRSNAVLNFIKTLDSQALSRVEFFEAHGGERTASRGDEAEWRAVEVHIFIGDIPPTPVPPHVKPLPRPRPTPQDKESLDWFVTSLSLSGGSIIAGVGVGAYWGSITFERPGREKLETTIAFAGPGIGLSLGIPGLEKLGRIGKLLQAAKVDKLLQFMQRSPILARALKWIADNGSGSAGALPSGTIGLVFPLRGGMELKKSDFSGVCAVQFLSGTAVAGSAGTLAIWFGAPGGTSIFDPYHSVTEARGVALVSTAGLGVAASLGASLTVCIGEIV